MNEEYLKSDAINQSLLVALSKGIGTYKLEKEKQLYYQEKPHFDIGEAVDMKLTDNGDFDEYFYISDELATKPGKGALSVVKEVYDVATRDYPDYVPKLLNDNRLERIIINACRNQNFGGSWPDDRKHSTIVDRGQEYYKALLKSRGRTVLSVEQSNLAERLAEKIKTHEFSGWIFSSGYPGVELIFQEPLYATYRGHNIKGLPDVLIVNNRGNAVEIEGRVIPGRHILPIDIKTTGGSVKAFPARSKEFRYDVQGAWYSLLCELNYPSYWILPFIFVVVSTSTTEAPLLFEMNQHDLDVARWGGNYTDRAYVVKPEVRSINGKHLSYDDVDVLGYEQMLDLYKWHDSNNQWEYDRKIIENHGIIKLEQWT